jgi:hypothetical protein
VPRAKLGATERGSPPTVVSVRSKVGELVNTLNKIVADHDAATLRSAVSSLDVVEIPVAMTTAAELAPHTTTQVARIQLNDDFLEDFTQPTVDALRSAACDIILEAIFPD